VNLRATLQNASIGEVFYIPVSSAPGAMRNVQQSFGGSLGVRIKQQAGVWVSSGEKPEAVRMLRIEVVEKEE
jgi:hypothetical protein